MNPSVSWLLFLCFTGMVAPVQDAGWKNESRRPAEKDAAVKDGLWVAGVRLRLSS